MLRSLLPAALPAGLLVLAASAAQAAVLTPTSVTVTRPAGSAPVNSNGAYVDDILLDMLQFSGASFNSADSFAAVARLEVLTGRRNINAEWGDLDGAADGDDNPFAKAGLVAPGDPVPQALQETTDPAIQDAALLNAFNSLSLSEMSDGEQGDFSFKVMFAKGLQDDAAGNANDGTPELIFFERGSNDTFTVEVITGGTFADAIYSDAYTLTSTDFGESGVYVDTTEIDARQMIGVGGLDLDVFNMTPGERAYGFRLTAANAGPDLNGFFLSAEDPLRFEDPLEPIGRVPAPPALPLAIAALGAFAGLRARRARPRA